MLANYKLFVKNLICHVGNMEMYLLKSGTLHYGFMVRIATVVNVQILLYKSFIHCFF